MNRIKKFTITSILAIMFLMVFSNDTMAAPSINLFTSKVATLDIAKEQAEQTFVIKDNIIIGIAPAMVGQSKIMLPDSVDGVPVAVDYNSLAEYDVAIEATKYRSLTDSTYEYIKSANDKAMMVMFLSLFSIIIILFATILFSEEVFSHEGYLSKWNETVMPLIPIIVLIFLNFIPMIYTSVLNSF